MGERAGAVLAHPCRPPLPPALAALAHCSVPGAVSPIAWLALPSVGAPGQTWDDTGAQDVGAVPPQRLVGPKDTPGLLGSRERQQLVQAVRAVEGNEACADCGAPAPGWVVRNIGAVVCRQCAAVHREFLVPDPAAVAVLLGSVSKVLPMVVATDPPLAGQELALVAPLTQRDVLLALVLGNRRVNLVLEHRCRATGGLKITPACTQEEREVTKSSCKCPVPLPVPVPVPVAVPLPCELCPGCRGPRTRWLLRRHCAAHGVGPGSLVLQAFVQKKYGLMFAKGGVLSNKDLDVAVDSGSVTALLQIAAGDKTVLTAFDRLVHKVCSRLHCALAPRAAAVSHI